MGTLTKVKQMLKLPNGTIRVLVEGLIRAEITEFIENKPNIMLYRLKIYEDHDR